MTAAKDEHIGALDGLRAGAILLVLLYHLTPGRDSSHGVRTLLLKLADIGWSGVDLFFVLSGFLITTKLLAAREDEHRFRDFYVRRALRIFPLYYAALLVLLILVPALTTFPFADARAQLPYWLYYSNFRLLPLPTDALLPIGHFWSLAIEEQFYLVWPAVIFFCRRRVSIAVCIAIPLMATLLRYAFASSGAEWSTTYAWTFCRADGLALGALIAFKRPSLRLSAIAAACAAPLCVWAAWRDKATLVATSLATPDAIVARALLPIAASVMFAALLVFALELRPLSRALSIAPFRTLARYSYGMYIFHFPLMPTLSALILPHFSSANVAALMVFVAGTLVSLGLAMLSYHAFELHFLRLKSRFA
ncbi:MAG TPA: acyltransferase [Thermoanaerobaculia bacterium]